MTTLKLSGDLVDADIAGAASIAQVLADYALIINDLRNGVVLSSEPAGSPSGRTQIYKDPDATGSFGEYMLKGAGIVSRGLDGELISYKSQFTSAKATSDNGEASIKAIIDAETTPKSLTSSIKLDSVNFVGEDSSKWSVTGAYTYKLSQNSVTGEGSAVESMVITSVSSMDVEGNSLRFNGNVKFDYATEEYVGYFTSMTLSFGSDSLTSSGYGTKITATGLKMTYEDLLALEAELVDDLLPYMLKGNDIITTADKDPTDTIFGYTGNDRITGSSEDDQIYGGDGESKNSGNDTLRGGAGDDELFGEDGDDILEGGAGDDLLNGGSGQNTLKGGKGADKFILDFANFDFTSKGKIGVTVVADYKTSEDDELELDDAFGEVAVYKTLKAAQADMSTSTVIYESSTGKMYYDEDGVALNESPTIHFATVVGIPNDYWE